MRFHPAHVSSVRSPGPRTWDPQRESLWATGSEQDFGMYFITNTQEESDVHFGPTFGLHVVYRKASEGGGRALTASGLLAGAEGDGADHEPTKVGGLQMSHGLNCLHAA